MSEEKVTLEERFDTIAKILAQMESGELSLDETFELYKEGLAQVKEANDMLDKVEKAMLVLNASGNLEEF